MLDKLLRIGLIACAVITPICLQAQEIRGPILGFIPDARGGVMPIIGIPGASVLGDRIKLSTEIRGAVISPKHDYAIALRNDDSQVVLVDLNSETPEVRLLHDTWRTAEVIGISPAGTAVALYDSRSRIVEMIGRLPKAPEMVRKFDVTGIPGNITAIALSDDGQVGIVKSGDKDDAKLWMLHGTDAPWQMPLDRPRAAGFLPNRRDAVVIHGGGQAADVILNVSPAFSRIPMITPADGIQHMSGVSVSEDGRQVFLSGDFDVITIVDLETLRPSSFVSCRCKPSGLHRLKGTSVFRLTEPSNEPLMVLDATSVPRIVVVPPRQEPIVLSPIKREWSIEKP